MSITGAGYLTVLDLLCDISYQLMEGIVDTTITSTQPAGYGDGGFGDGGFGDGNGTVITVPDIRGLYAGALVVVGYQAGTAEVVTVLEVEPGSDGGPDGAFIAVLVNTHANGERVFAPTFPVQQPYDPLFTQGEMLAYVATACNDFLVDVPLCYAIAESVSVAPTQQNGLLPGDCMVPARVAFLTASGPYPLRETSQANLDGVNYRWQQDAPDQPKAYFRDKVPLQNFGIWPRVNNTAEFEIVYSQRQPSQVQLLDGFLFPDPFVPIIKSRVLEFAYSKDGEQRNPGLARYFAARYAMGKQIAKMVLEAVEDPNLQMAQ